MVVAGQDVNCIVRQQLTAASVCPRQQWDVAVGRSRAGGTQGGRRQLQSLGGSGEVPEQEDSPLGDTNCSGPCPTSLPPELFSCVPQMFPALPDIPCLPHYFLTPPPGPVTFPKAHETTKSPPTHGPVPCHGLEVPHHPPFPNTGRVQLFPSEKHHCSQNQPRDSLPCAKGSLFPRPLSPCARGTGILPGVPEAVGSPRSGCQRGAGG